MNVVSSFPGDGGDSGSGGGGGDLIIDQDNIVPMEVQGHWC